MPDADGRYSNAETRDFRSPPCPECGGPTRQDWADVTTLADAPGEQWWIPGLYGCLNPARHFEQD